MNKAKDLQLALYALFRSGADEDHDEVEMAELLEDMDFNALLQGLWNELTTVYAYSASGELAGDYEYHGPALFPAGAIRLYEDMTDCTNETVFCSRALELWLLPDLSFAITSQFRVMLAGGRYETEYRTFKGRNWREAGISIDFLQLADDLEEMSRGTGGGEMPVYEL